MSEPALHPSFTSFVWYERPLEAIAWLEQAFGFETRMLVQGEGGDVRHSALAFGNGLVGIVGPPDERSATPIQLGGRFTQAIHVQLDDGIDAHYARAQAAGAAITRDIADQAYGDRVYACTDPEGHTWSFGQTLNAMSIAEMENATGARIRTSLPEETHG